MAKSIRHEKINFLYKGEELNIDRYELEEYSGLSTKEYTIDINHNKKEVTGDTIKYGEWYTLPAEELQELLSYIEEQNALVLSYEGYTIG